MSYHMDEEVNGAFIRLMDALCMWERNTGRASTLAFIPWEEEERMVVAVDGKPLPPEASFRDMEIPVKLAIENRRRQLYEEWGLKLKKEAKTE